MPKNIDLWLLGTGCAVPSMQRWHPAILFIREGNYFLFDCGEGTQLKLEAAKISPMKIDKIFISHWHADHFAGLLPLIETLHLCDRKTPLEIYGPEASKFVENLLNLSYWGINFEIKTYDCNLNKMEKILETSEYDVYSIPVNHSVPAVGYMIKEKSHWNINMKKAKKYGLEPGPILTKIKENGKIIFKGKTINLEDIGKETPGRKIVYSGDTRLNENLFKLAENADILIHDATFVEKINEKSHSTVKDVAELAKKHKIKKLILTHMSRRYMNTKEIAKIARKIFKNSIIAEDMMHIII